MRTIVPNTDYFKPIILKFKTNIYSSNCKIIHNFCTCETVPLPRRKITPWGEILIIDIFRKNTSKQAKLMAEPIFVII